MPVSAFLLALCRFLLPPAIISTVYIYLYPFFHGCEFPEPPSQATEPEVCYLKPVQDPSNSAKGPNGAVSGSRGGLWGLGKQVAHTWQDLNEKGQNKLSGRKAPFRLLALGDPQLEGDTSLPKKHEPIFPSLSDFFGPNMSGGEDGSPAITRVFIRIMRMLQSLRDLAVEDMPRLLGGWRKRLDLWGNDYYLAHVYRSMKWWTGPSHITVLGDLVGSQWIDDDEFSWRGWRFWNRIFSDGQMIEDSIALGDGSNEPEEELGKDTTWENRIINIAGNHDIGYSGEIDEPAINRFEKQFGRVNWDRWFRLPLTSSPGDDPGISTPRSTFEFAAAKSNPNPAIRLVVLNDMNLDGPVYSPSHQSDTYSFINRIISTSHPVEDPSVLTILLTHVPLHKRAGVCVDGPYFSYYEENAGLLREQNHLSGFSSRQVLEAIFGMSGVQDAPNAGMGRSGVILDGHDHEGCDVWHYFNYSKSTAPGAEDQSSDGEWAAVPYPIARRAKLPVSSEIPGIREITVRSMMGSYGGNAGLLSAWYEGGANGAEGAGRWQVEYAACPFVIQHVWWAVHVIDLVLLGLLLATAAAYLGERLPERRQVKLKGQARDESLTSLISEDESGSVSVKSVSNVRSQGAQGVNVRHKANEVPVTPTTLGYRA
ncbi:MAG: hypothetical protein M1822_006697 [Bathelium mastoideum]|nr:MAG: hypothetical protein M1822_006697 [Bathelium mastoideum]